MAAADAAPLMGGSAKGPADLKTAAMLVFNSKMGRWIIVSAIGIVLFVTLIVEAPSESLSAYRSSASNHVPQIWRPANRTALQEHGIFSPMEESQTALDVSSGALETMPSGLEKENPSFHLVVPQTDGAPMFCKFVLSSMILNYPPPTIATYQKKWGAGFYKETDKIESVLEVLQHKEFRDDDLVLITEGDEALFQLPAEVLVQQYESMALEANVRLKEQYGVDESGQQLFRQTVFFAAEKTCPPGHDELPSCLAIPKSPLAKTVYGAKAGTEPQYKRPRYLSASSVIGPVRDLREIYNAAHEKKDEFGASGQRKDVDAITAQALLSSVFGEQEWARTTTAEAAEEGTTWYEWAKKKYDRPFNSPEPYMNIKMTLDSSLRYEYSIGLDYHGTLFGRLATAAGDEFQALTFDEQNNLKQTVHYEAEPILPPVLKYTASPYSDIDPDRKAAGVPSGTKIPNDIPYITELKVAEDLDSLPTTNTSWSNIPLISNTYYPSVPALLTLKTRDSDSAHWERYNKQIFDGMWYTPHSRALLRRFLRTYPQGLRAYHNSAIGGSWSWDVRGGQGGVWLKNNVYMEWGNDFCTGLQDVVFGDGKGRWLWEHGPPIGHEDDKEAIEVKKPEKRSDVGTEGWGSRFGDSIEDYWK